MKTGPTHSSQLTSQSLSPLPVPVSLPPMRILPIDDVKDVATLEWDAQLVTRDVQVVIRVVWKVGPVMVLKMKQKNSTLFKIEMLKLKG